LLLAAVSKPALKGVDLDAQGLINEIPTLDFDLQGIKDEDKPWRKPGADITDYFNYGFNEETWINYCMKQRRLRAENTTNKVNK
jgi:pre-mRNA 3'-end-processing factor FIP1